MIKEQAIDQDARTMGRGTSDGSNNKRLDGGWISEQLKDRWMDLEAIEGNDGWCKRLMDKGALDGATDGACDGVLSNRRSDD